MDYHKAYQNYDALNALARDFVITEDERQDGVENIRESIGLGRRPTEKEMDICSGCHGNKTVVGKGRSVTCSSCGGTGKRSIKC